MKAQTLLALIGGAACVGTTLFAAPTPENTPDKFVRYVEATGSQYVDTGIVGRHGTKAECKVEWMSFADSAFLASGDWSASQRFFMCYCRNNSGNMMTAQGTGDNVRYNDTDLLFETKRIYTYMAESTAADGNNVSTNIITIDGTKIFTKTYTAIDPGMTLYVFACNQKANTVIGKSRARCYGLKIWQDNALVRDFKPCVKGTRAGLYDTVSETIFYSDSGTNLTYDKNCDVPDAFIDYVESFGNSYVDTGIIGRSGTGAKMEMAWIGESSDQALLDSRDGNNRFYFAHRNTGNKWLWGYGTYGTFDGFTPGEKCYVDASFAVGEQTITIREGGPDGTVVGSYAGTSTTSVDTGRSLYLFCCNKSGDALEKRYWGKARVYWLQLFQGGEMVRDFRPCLKYGQAALYDAVSKTIFYPEGDPLGYDNSVAASPDEVVYVDYIESDGFTHLDTQVAARSPTRATGTFSWTQLRTLSEEKQYFCADYRSYLACGCYNSSSDANRFYMVTETSQKPWIGYGNNSKSFGSAMTTGTKYDFDVSFAAGAQTYSQTPEGGSATTSSTDWSGEADGQGSLYLFACNDAKNKKPIYRSAARCYGLTIYQGEGGETTVRNFRPCVKDGQAALYDTVSQRIFYPVPAIPAEGNTGAILPESAQAPIDAYLEYVETDGTQYIDTGVIGKAGTSAEFKETNLRPNGGVEECFLGAFGSTANTRFYMWYHGGIDTLAFGYAGAYWRPSKSDPATPAAQWGEGYADVYRLYCNATNHARVAFSAGSQRITLIDDANGNQTVISVRSLADDIDTGCNLYLFANNNNGTAASFAKSRLYWLKLKQDGTYARKFQPVRLKNGLIGLWDDVEEKVYLPKNASGGFATFSDVGQESAKIFNKSGLVLTIR